jgi:ribonuclease P protein component
LAKQFTLGKNERLKSLKAIEQLFKEGHRFTVSPFRINYTTTTNGLKFGVGVSTKNFKKAVDRNRIKRLTREAFRLQKKILEDKLHEDRKGLNIFFIYTAKELPVYEQVLEKINSILKKLVKIADENNSSDT